MNDYSDIKIGKMIHQMKIHQSDENDTMTVLFSFHSDYDKINIKTQSLTILDHSSHCERLRQSFY